MNQRRLWLVAIRCVISILLVILLSGPGLSQAELNKEDILRLSRSLHSRKDLPPQLRLLPDAREYKTEYTTTPTKGDPQTKKGVVVRQKTVQGKFIVLESEPEEAKGKLIAVVTYDEEAEVYRKWILAPDGSISKSVGITARNSRAIGWLQVDGLGTQTLTHEQFTDKGGSWTERISVRGELMAVVRGSSTKTK